MGMRPAWKPAHSRPASPMPTWMRGRILSTSCGKDEECRAGVPDLLALLLVLLILLVVDLLADHISGLINLDLPVFAVDHDVRLINGLAAGHFLIDLADGRAAGLSL